MLKSNFGLGLVLAAVSFSVSANAKDEAPVFVCESPLYRIEVTHVFQEGQLSAHRLEYAYSEVKGTSKVVGLDSFDFNAIAITDGFNYQPAFGTNVQEIYYSASESLKDENYLKIVVQAGFSQVQAFLVLDGAEAVLDCSGDFDLVQSRYDF